MTDHVFIKFPDQCENIRSLLLVDASFREVCADYEEICIWLAVHCRSANESTEECDHALELVRELEDEINKILTDTGD